MRLWFVDASDDIPDNIATIRVKGDDGHVYTSGIFDRLQEPVVGLPDYIYVIAVERLEPMQ